MNDISYLELFLQSRSIDEPPKSVFGLFKILHSPLNILNCALRPIYIFRVALDFLKKFNDLFHKRFVFGVHIPIMNAAFWIALQWRF